MPHHRQKRGTNSSKIFNLPVRYNPITIGSGCRFPIHLNERSDEIRTQQTEGYVTTDRLCLLRKKLHVIALHCYTTVTRERDGEHTL